MEVYIVNDYGWPDGIPNTHQAEFWEFPRNVTAEEAAADYEATYGFRPPYVVIYHGWPYAPVGQQLRLFA